MIAKNATLQSVKYVKILREQAIFATTPNRLWQIL